MCTKPYTVLYRIQCETWNVSLVSTPYVFSFILNQGFSKKPGITVQVLVKEFYTLLCVSEDVFQDTTANPVLSKQDLMLEKRRRSPVLHSPIRTGRGVSKGKVELGWISQCGNALFCFFFFFGNSMSGCINLPLNCYKLNLNDRLMYFFILHTTLAACML